MREHEVACERDTTREEPTLTAVLREAVDCIVESTHAFRGPQGPRGTRTGGFHTDRPRRSDARVFVALTLTGQYESALAVTRTLIEGGIACAFLMEHPDEAARWRRGEIDLKYGDMASAVIEAHATRDEAKTPGEGEA
jgi:hypothetical protein